MTLPPDYPVKSHWATISAHRLHYLDDGAGPPVVMVHGNPNWTYYWRKLIPAISDQFRCLPSITWAAASAIAAAGSWTALVVVAIALGILFVVRRISPAGHRTLS